MSKITKMIMSGITDQQFFQSAALRRRLESIAAAQTSRYRQKNGVSPIRVKILYEPESTTTAFTDNKNITINAANVVVSGAVDRHAKYERLCGLFAHELGHVLYTDFLASNTYFQDLMNNGRIYLSSMARMAPDLEKLRREMEQFLMKCGSTGRTAFTQIAHEVCNCVEDGYIENRMLRQFPGSLGYCLSKHRAAKFDLIPTLSEMIEKEKEGQIPLVTVLQLILTYSLYGTIKFGEAPKDHDRAQELYDVTDIIDAYLTTHSSWGRLSYLTELLISLWHRIQPIIPLDEEMPKQLHQLGMLAGVSAQGTSLESPLAGYKAGELKAPTGLPNVVDRDRLRAIAESVQNASPDTEGTDGAQEYAFDAGGTSSNCDETAQSCAEKTAREVSRILSETTEEVEEQSFVDQLTQEPNNTDLGDIHKDISWAIHREVVVPQEFVTAYDELKSDLLRISKQLQRTIKPVLKDRKTGGKRTGLIVGPRLNSHALYRTDGEVFCKTDLPDENPRLAVCLLIDESGSTTLDNRYVYARSAAVILHNFCTSLEIPVMIYGHAETVDLDCELISYAEFDRPKKDDKYRIMGIRPHGCNRDGAALRYCCSKLVRRPEQTKLMIIISDGKPNARGGYNGEVAYADLRDIKKEYQRRGIIFVAAAIGSDLPTIKSIYGESFLDITDLQQLPVKLTEVVKRHVRV